MVIAQNDDFPFGYTAISEINGKNSDMLLDFGILRLHKGEKIVSSIEKERAWLLLKGRVNFAWNGKVAEGQRESCFNENPVALHVPSGLAVEITAEDECEIAVEQVVNDIQFPGTFYDKDDVRCDVFGKSTLGETSIRTVRTVFDGETVPESNMVLGEVINHPGKWSSYPPHDHPQPEIYHYRFLPKQGFGVSLLGDTPELVYNRYSSMITPNITHAQVAAPGYAMYYIWMIPHLPGERWVPTTRYYAEEHSWLLEHGAKIWPEK